MWEHRRRGGRRAVAKSMDQRTPSECPALTTESRSLLGGALVVVPPPKKRPSTDMSSRFFRFVQTFLGDFNLQKLPFRRLQGLWETSVSRVVVAKVHLSSFYIMAPMGWASLPKYLFFFGNHGRATQHRPRKGCDARVPQGSLDGGSNGQPGAISGKRNGPRLRQLHSKCSQTVVFERGC